MTLIAALLCTMMLLALGGALTMTATVETQSSVGADAGREAFHAAEATAERVLSDLAMLADWAGAFDGTVRSSFVDGASSGTRDIAGFTVDLDALTADQNAWRPDDGIWRLFAHAPLTALSGDTTVFSRMYGVAWVAPDPLRPSAIVVTAHAYGPSGVRRMVEVTVDRTPQQTIRLLAWREHRQ